MNLSILQLWEPEMPPDWVIAFQQSTQVLSVIIGLFIAYQAYRGYRRNESQPMLFIAIGFSLVLAVPFIVFLLHTVFAFIPVAAIMILSQVSQISGLAAILYALRMPT